MKYFFKWSPFHGRGNFFPFMSSNSNVLGLMTRITLNGPSQLASRFPLSTIFPVASICGGRGHQLEYVLLWHDGWSYESSSVFWLSILTIRFPLSLVADPGLFFFLVRSRCAISRRLLWKVYRFLREPRLQTRIPRRMGYVLLPLWRFSTCP